jgi:hypothetical protein
MRFSILKIMAAFLLLCLGADYGQADFQFGVTADKEGLKSFCLAVGEHYRVPEKQVSIVRTAKVSDNELPVVFFLAEQAGQNPSAILKLRFDGKSWMDIAIHFGLTANVFYVPVKNKPGPPYGKAYGHFKNKKKKEWETIRLTDADIINFVNLRFISDHYGFSPDEVIKMRSAGKSFIEINDKAKRDKNQSQKISQQNNADKNSGKGKGNKK